MKNNPCLFMATLGYHFEFIRGTDSEDLIVYTGDKYKIQFNLFSENVVITLLKNNSEYYGNPTVFLDNVTLECISIIREKLGWCKHVRDNIDNN